MSKTPKESKKTKADTSGEEAAASDPAKDAISKAASEAAAEAAKVTDAESASELASGTPEEPLPQGVREPRPEPEPEPEPEETEEDKSGHVSVLKGSSARRPEKGGITGGTWIGVVLVLVATFGGLWFWNTHSEGRAGRVEVANTDESGAASDEAAPGDAATPMSDYDQLAYLIENGQREGVEVTPTKLQLLPLKLSGSVLRPKATDMVKVHYEGRFIDGRVFDSSYNGPPAVFPLNGVIPGWTEGLQHMAIGDKFELTIPSELAYGDQGYPGAIPPNTTLVFDVELLGIVGKEAEAEAEAAALQAAEEALSSEAAPSGEAALSSEEAVPSTEEAVPSTEEAVEADAAVAPIEAAIEEMPEEEPQATDPAGDETEPAASTGQTQPQDE